MTLTDAITTRFYASYNSIEQQLPGALTYDGALTTPRRANAASVAGDQARDIDSLRPQNRTSFDCGAAKLDVWVFVSVKTLQQPIYQTNDKKSGHPGGTFSLNPTGGTCEPTYGGALTTPRRANAACVAGDQARDIDSLRLQNRTSFDFGAAKLDVGVFVSVKTLHQPIYQLIDQKSVDRGGYFRFDYAGGPVEATLGGELRVGDVHSRRFVNVAGRRGARTFDARQDARSATLYGELRLKPAAGLRSEEQHV